MATVDLHLHTNYSDGRHSPEEVVLLARGAGLKLIAITDHDTTDGLAEGAAAALAHGIDFIPGIEITTAFSHEQHILGYGIDKDAPALREMCGLLLRYRSDRVDRTIEFLRGRGVMITRAQVAAEAARPDEYLGRPYIAAAMIRAGYAESLKDAFARHLATDEYKKIAGPKPSARESIEAIRAAGGVAVLAHPDSLRLEGKALEEHISGLKTLGLSGLECHYGTYDKVQTEAWRALARKYDLVETGGSDFHGLAVKPDIQIGTGRDGLLDYDDLGVRDRLNLKF